MEKKKILIVDDEPKIVEAVSAYLAKSGYETFLAMDGVAAVALFEKNKPDLVILDRMLPGLSGEEVCRVIRRSTRTPIIMLTAKIDEEEKIEGLNMGADDYVTKPFSPRELVARVGSLLRRTQEGSGLLFDTMSWNQGDLEIDLKAYKVRKSGNLVNLTPNEFKLLSTLVRYPNKTFTREELIESALGIDYDGYERTIDSHIKNLRTKIEDDTANPMYILTVRGIGYKFGDHR